MQKTYSAYIKQYAIRKINEITSYNFQNINISKDNIKIACILDEFSYECFRYEGLFTQLSTNNWRETLENIKPDFLFVESAWEGLNKQWTGKIANLHLSKDNTLLSIIKYCNENYIPTVFWAKEDPCDFIIFIEASKHFDYIFTTDLDSVPKYKKIVNHNNIFALSFAAQPYLHNPIDKDKEKIGKVAFAGGWYSKFSDRCKDMEDILNPAFKYNLAIYDRFKNSYNKKNLFPPEYNPYIKDSLNYKDIIKEYKKYEVFLNVNSVTVSPTMFSRRIFELLASGIPVISSYSKGIENYFKDIVLLSNNQNDTDLLLDLLLNDSEKRDRLSALGQREIFNHHTYTHRFNTILNKLGIKKANFEKEGVSVITCTNRPYSLENILANYVSQLYPLKELIIIINNDCIDQKSWKDMVNEYEDIKIYKLPQKESLGKCLNYAIEKSKYPYISKFDDDDYYGPNYLIDSVNAFKYTDADVVGKNTFYAYLERSQSLVLRNPNQEHQYSKYLSGSTLTMKKDIFSNINFRDLSAGEDIKFLMDCLNIGIKIYSTDRFNHVVIRRPDINTHSWKITDNTFMKDCEVIKKTHEFKSIVTI